MVKGETEARSTFLTPMRSDCASGRAGNKYPQILPFYPTYSQHCFNNHLPAQPECSRDPYSLLETSPLPDRSTLKTPFTAPKTVKHSPKLNTRTENAHAIK